MSSWLVRIAGLILLLAIALFAALTFTFWKYEHDFPKSILNKDDAPDCVISKQDFVLLKTGRSAVGIEFFEFLPKPDGQNYVYRHYVPRSILKDDGTDAINTTGAIEVPSGTQFKLKDIFQHRTLNGGSEYYYWLEQSDLQLDSNFFFEISDSFKNGSGIIPAGEMAKFPENPLFRKGCA